MLTFTRFQMCHTGELAEPRQHRLCPVLHPQSVGRGGQVHPPGCWAPWAGATPQGVCHGRQVYPPRVGATMGRCNPPGCGAWWAGAPRPRGAVGRYRNMQSELVSRAQQHCSAARGLAILPFRLSWQQTLNTAREERGAGGAPRK